MNNSFDKLNLEPKLIEGLKKVKYKYTYRNSGKDYTFSYGK